MPEDNIPSVELYVSDKWIILAHALGGAILVFIGTAGKQPATGYEWAILAAAMIGGAINPLVSRLRPTPKQAGALRIAGGVMRRLQQADDVADGTVSAMPSRLQTETLQAIVSEATEPKPELMTKVTP